MNYLARVNPKYFAAIELYAAKNDVRYYLNGVRIEPHPQLGAVIVATNGHRLAAIHDPDGWCEEPIIVGDIPRSLVAACKAKGNELTFTAPKQLWVSKTSAVVMGCDDTEPPQDPFNPMALHATRITLIDAKYPDWRRVAPTKRANTPGRFPSMNPKYLAELHEAASILVPNHKKWGGAVRLEAQDEHSSIIARIPHFELLERFFALIMPLRDMEFPRTIVPAFAMAPEPAQKAKPRVRHTPEGWVEIGAPAAEGAPA